MYSVDFSSELAEIAPDSLSKSIGHFSRPSGKNLLKRTEKFFTWQDQRVKSGLYPYFRSLDTSPQPCCTISDSRGISSYGINFASQDYLSLASHPSTIETVVEAVKIYGAHSAGSPFLLGNTSASLKLENMLMSLLQMEHIVLFPTGWAAGFGVVKGLIRRNDYVVMDEATHACLQEGVYSSTQNVVRYKHINTDDVRNHLAEIRSQDVSNAILVITEGLFSMDSDTPDLTMLQDICNEFEATLLVDVAHDLGALGKGGTGFLGIQEMLGKVDIVMGSFSKSFASNGGFVATHSHAVKQFIKHYAGSYAFSNALSPIQASIVSNCIEIIQSPEGEDLRKKLMDNILALRKAFEAKSIQCMGIPSPIVPVPTGNEKVARIASRIIFERNVFANLVEFPAVPAENARFRMQVMANHSPELAETAANVISDSINQAREIVTSL